MRRRADYAKQTVSTLHKYVPELKVILSDVRTLPFRDEYFIAYWSLGVIEHFQEGFESIALEMTRVLKNGGYLFLTFPYISPIRNLKARFGLYKPWDKGTDLNNFYQFALDAHEVSTQFKGLGFKLVKCKPYDTKTGS
jgi:SAM-dependent methyltransferase